MSHDYCSLGLDESEKYSKGYKLKRLFDFCLALMGLMIFSPLLVFIPFAIWLEDRGPIFYKQQRVGKGLKVFTVYKFRSMVKNAEEKTGPVWAKENDPRVTMVGRVLRATAMDELPQLFSILKGDMSFVGPRTLRPFFVEKFAKEVPNYLSRFSVPPGLTGLAQIYAKYDSSAHQKLRFDLLYIKKRSFLLDLKLILISVWITLRHRWESRNRKIKRIKIGRWRIT